MDRSLILTNRPHSNPLPVILLPRRSVALLGPGRFLRTAYVSAGERLVNGVGRAAHLMGLGPVAVTDRIVDAFGDRPDARQSLLNEIYDSGNGLAGKDSGRMRTLKEDCRKLIEYTLPSASCDTRIKAFKSIINLITRYPGLRRLFFQSPTINQAACSPNEIYESWKNDVDNFPEGWEFSMQFAAFCVANNIVALDLEKIRPSELGCIYDGKRSIVESLMGYITRGKSAVNTSAIVVGDENYARLIAVRHIAGILELPAFWADINYRLQRFVVDKLCRHTIQLIEDAGANSDSPDIDTADQQIYSDIEGIDCLANAILLGVRRWITRKVAFDLVAECWLAGLIALLRILRDTVIIPIASRCAAENWEQLLRPYIPDQSPELHLTEDSFLYIFDFVYRPAGSDSANLRHTRLSTGSFPEPSPIQSVETASVEHQQEFKGKAQPMSADTESESAAQKDLIDSWTLAHNSIDTSTLYFIVNRASGRVWSYIALGSSGDIGYVVCDRNNQPAEPYFKWRLAVNSQNNGMIIASAHYKCLETTQTMTSTARGSSFRFIPVPGEADWYFIASGFEDPPTAVTGRPYEDTSRPASTTSLSIDDHQQMWQLIRTQ